MGRQLTRKDLAYESIAHEWASYISDFDTARRVDVLVHRLLGPEAIRGARALEVGCGLGYFTREIIRHKPASMTAIDISPTLVEKLAASHPDVECIVGDALDLDAALGRRQFDVILSSEVIEHTPDPSVAFAQMAAHLQPGGKLVISAPNRRWKWLLILAQASRIRNTYQGFENWVAPHELLAWAKQAGLEMVHTTGIHTIPWHLSHRLVQRLDQSLGSRNYSFAVNLAMLAQRPLR